MANIILGNSRTDTIDPLLIRRAAGQECYNLSFGGASLPEIAGAFWYGEKLTRLKEVCIGVNLNIYNAYYSRNLLAEPLRVMDNPLLYLTERKVGECLLLLLSGGKDTSSEPGMSREEFWKYQLEVSGRRSFAQYAYPEKYYAQLEEIGRHCKSKKFGSCS